MLFEGGLSYSKYLCWLLCLELIFESSVTLKNNNTKRLSTSWFNFVLTDISVSHRVYGSGNHEPVHLLYI